MGEATKEEVVAGARVAVEKVEAEWVAVERVEVAVEELASPRVLKKTVEKITGAEEEVKVEREGAKEEAMVAKKETEAKPYNYICLALVNTCVM
jgi:hypothetical protein